jgi:large conductance mechanosensitive channel
VAFNNLVTSFTDSFLKPVLTRIGGFNVDRPGISIGDDNYLQWPAFVNAIITFLLTAATVYFLLVLPMNKLAERRKRGVEPEPESPSDEVRLLTEIRDALLAGDRTAATSLARSAPVKPGDPTP